MLQFTKVVLFVLIVLLAFIQPRPARSEGLNLTLTVVPGQRTLEKTSYDDGLQDIASKGYTRLYFNDLLNSASNSVNDTSFCTNRWNRENKSGEIDWTYIFCWREADLKDDWTPQGITGSGEAQWNLVISNVKNILLVSWYTDKEPESLVATSGSGSSTRLSIVDLNTKKYRHVELVRPCSTSTLGVCKLGSHAGGLAWVGPWLYVANTTGLYVFNMNLVYRVPNIAGSAVIPAVSKWSLTDTSGVRISSVSLDRTAARPQLVTVEYSDNREAGGETDIFRWTLEENGLLSNTSSVRSVLHHETEIRYLQGIASWEGNYLLSSSHANGSSDDDMLFRRRPGESTIPENANFRVPSQNVQDLYIDPQRFRVWSLTEHPQKTFDDEDHSDPIRFIFSYTLNSALNNY